MKQSFEIIKYYSKNKRISKVQGILFMLFGWIILGFIIYGLFFVYNNMDKYYEDWNSDSGSSSSCSTYTDSYISSINEKIVNINSRFDSAKTGYEEVKTKYSATSNIDKKVELFDQMGDKLNALIDLFNEAITHYNNNVVYYEDCSDGSTSSQIENMRTYIDQKETEQDNEFSILKPKAEAEGYFYYD